ncbi:hypothetical protein Tco_0513369 [Tanacetum coccineum]
MIASSESRNSSKNMPRFSSNDMVHNHYLEEAKNKTQERDRNSKTSVMPSAILQNTANGSKPKPRSTNQMTRNWPTSKSSCVTTTIVPKANHYRNSSSFSDCKHFVCSTCQKCVFNANHDACVTKFLKEVNSRAKVQSHKGLNLPPHRLKPSKALHFQEVGVATSELFVPSRNQPWDFTPFSVILASPFTTRPSLAKRLKPRTTTSIEVHTTDMITMASMIKLESLFGPLFDEYFNGENQVVSKSYVVTIADASNKRQQQSNSVSSASTPRPIVTAVGNFDL